MLKRKKVMKVAVFAIVISLLAVTPVFAQGETDPVGEPEQVEEQSKFFGSKIVQLIVDFYMNLFNPPQEDPPVEEPPVGEEPAGDPPAGDPPEGGEPEEVPEPEPTVVPAAVVASMKEDDKLGYGEIVKLLDIASNAAAVCADTGEFCDVTYESIVAEYKAGHGMGELFKKYGKPIHTGVGQLKKDKLLKEKKK